MQTEWKLAPVEPTGAMQTAGTVVVTKHGGPGGLAAAAYRAMLAAAPQQPAPQPLTDEQKRLDGLLTHARWLTQNQPPMDGVQGSWAENVRRVVNQMHDWLKLYLPEQIARHPLKDEQTTLGRTIYELSQDERSAAEAAFTKAHGSKPELGLPSDRAWMEGFAAARAHGIGEQS